MSLKKIKKVESFIGKGSVYSIRTTNYLEVSILLELQII